MLAVVFGPGFSPCRLPVLHIKQAAFGALSSSPDRTCQLGGRVEGLASNFQTQSLAPGDLSLPLSRSLSLSLTPSLSFSLSHLSAISKYSLPVCTH